MPYALYSVLSAMPQIAMAAVLPIIGIVVVSFLIKMTRPQAQGKPLRAD